MSITVIKKGKLRLFSLLLLLSLIYCQLGEAAPQPDRYALQLFAEDAVFRNPNSSAASYFEIYSGSTVTAPAVLDLWYSYSQTVRSDLSSVTVLLNGVPVASRSLTAQQNTTHNWQVPLPINQFKIGFNEVRVSVMQRSIDGLCRDVDNDANWFIIRPETKVNFGIARSPYTLPRYPRPFLNEYLAAKTNTVFYLPPDADQFMVASLLNIATDWGNRKLSGAPQRLEVRIGGVPGKTPANEIILGLTNKWLPNQKIPNGVPVLSLSDLPNGYSRLLITGDDSNSIVKAMSALVKPQLIKTFPEQQQLLLTSPLPVDTNASSTEKRKSGLYTLVDLGHQDITVAGVFRQDTAVTIPRPPNYKVGDGSYVELHFRHSKLLDPKKSAVTVYINDIPITSSALLAENAEKGILKAPIPASELNKAAWRVRFAFYHDLGIIDCSKRYDDVAWSVIEKETTIFLAQGEIERAPALEDFPNNFSEESGIINLTMLLPEKPSQEELSAALKLAYYIGQQNNRKIVWQIQSMAAFDAKSATGSVIALGKNNDADYWNAVKQYLAISPESNSSYHLAPWLEVMTESIAAFDIYQVAEMPANKLFYAFMYTSPQRLNKLLNFALTNGSSLNGQVTLVNAQGEHFGYKQPAKTPVQDKLNWLKSLIAGSGVIGMYAAVFAAVLVATLILMFFMRKRL